MHPLSLFILVVLRYSPGFYPFSGPSPSTHPGPSSILAWIPHFRHSPRFYFSGTCLDSSLFWHSPIFHLFGTHPNSTLSGACPDSTFPVLTRILSFPDTHTDPSPILARISTFPVLAQILPFSGTCLDFYFSGTRPDSAIFWHFPKFHLSNTRPDSALFRHSPEFHLFGTFPDSTFSSTFPDSTFSALSLILPFPVLAQIQHFRYSPEFYPFLVLTKTLLRYSPGFHISGTRPNSTLS